MSQKDSHYITTAKIAYRLMKQVLPISSHAKNTRHYELPQLAACLLMKSYLDLSYRAMEEWLLGNNRVCQVFGLQRVPDHTTLQRAKEQLHNVDFEKMKEQILVEEHRKNDTLLLNDQENLSITAISSWPSRLMLLWLAGMVTLLPIKILNLPYNFELVDIWILGGMPVMLYVYSLKRPRVLSLSYTIPMWLVLISSFISAFASPSPMRSIIVILKEVYLFVWFFFVMTLLFQLSARNMRQVLRVWSVVAICHGIVMIAQFFSPDVWRFTNSLGGNTVRYDVYRAAGLFICDKAGCANKAAFFQLLGFVPLLLAGYSKRTTILLGIFLFASMMTSGSMGATLAFSSGLIVAVFTIAYLKKSLSTLVKNFLQILVAFLLLGGVLFIVGSQNSGYLNHFQSIILGRFDKSSGGRFNLWGRGIDVLLEHDAFFWGVGPENFRVVDESGNDNQLHNDTLAFLVERGLLGLAGLGLFAGITLKKAVQILQLFREDPKRVGLGAVVFLAMLVATIVESLTHQVFHTRELWLALAVEEAVLYKMVMSKYDLEATVPTIQESLQYRPGLLAQPEATING